MTIDMSAEDARTVRKLKSRIGCLLWLVVVFFVAIFFLFELSMIQYPFLNSRSSLNAHLKADFGMELPASAKVENACWVGARYPEELFAVTLPPADAVRLADELKQKGQAKDYEFSDYNELAKSTDPTIFRRMKPSYRIPTWWNSPPVADPIGFTFLIKDIHSVPRNDYKVFVSPITGQVYIAWGGF